MNGLYASRSEFLFYEINLCIYRASYCIMNLRDLNENYSRKNGKKLNFVDEMFTNYKGQVFFNFQVIVAPRPVCMFWLDSRAIISSSVVFYDSVRSVFFRIIHSEK